MAITDTQQAAQSATSAAVSAAEAKQYLLEAQQGYEDTSKAYQDAKDAADSALLSKQSAETSEVNAQQAATEAKSARDEAVEAASGASDYARNKFTFYKTASDPDGTIVGLAATTDGQSFWVAQGPDALSAAWQYQNKAGVAVLQAKQPGTAAITGTVREFPTLAAAQADADAGNILNGGKCWVTSDADVTLADGYINNAGTLVATGRKMPSQSAVDGAAVKAEFANDATAALLVALEIIAIELGETNGSIPDIVRVINEHADALSGALVAYEMLSLRVANDPEDIADLKLVSRENTDATAALLVANELISARMANAPDDIATNQLNISFSLDIILNSLFLLNKYDFDQFITANDIPATIKPMGELTYIPDLADINAFISYGQSLSVGGGSGNTSISLTQPYDNLMYSSGVKGNTFTGVSPLIEQNGETICSGMANFASLSMLRDDGVTPPEHVIFSGAPGQGSTNIATLSKGGQAWNKFLNFVTNLPVVNVGKTCAVQVIAWLHGEQDQNPDATPYTTYLAALLKLQVDITELAQSVTGQKTPVYMLTYQHSSHTRINNAATQRAYIQAARQSDYFTLVTPTYPFPHNTDTIHLINTSYKWLGAYFGRAYKQLIIERRIPDSLFPMGATWSGNEVRVKFRVPEAPLIFRTDRVPLTTNYGFKVQTEAGVEIGISTVAIEGDDTVLITLSSTPTAAPLVRYALDYLPESLKIVNGACGNLCDSTDETCTFDGVTYGLEFYSPAFELQSYTNLF